jgi:hypothetical protein
MSRLAQSNSGSLYLDFRLNLTYIKHLLIPQKLVDTFYFFKLNESKYNVGTLMTRTLNSN